MGSRLFSPADRKTEEFIETPARLRSCPPELREEILRTLLDVLRRSLAVKVDVLDPQKQLDLVEQTKPRLLEDTVWYLDDPMELVKSVVAYPRPKQGAGPHRVSSSPRTAASAAIYDARWHLTCLRAALRSR